MIFRYDDRLDRGKMHGSEDVTDRARLGNFLEGMSLFSRTINQPIRPAQHQPT
jgi:hypothetical protein